MAAYTLAQMLDEVELQLNDATNAIWATTLLTRAIRASLSEINRYFPRLVKAVINATANNREYSLSALTNLLVVVGIWYPYTSTDPEYPANSVNYTMIDDATLYLLVADDPIAGTGTIRVFYLAGHTIKDLDAEAAGTLSRILEELVIEGACAHAVAIKAADTIGEINTSEDTPRQWREEADRRWKTWYNRIWRLRRDPSDARVGQWPVDKWESQP